MLLILGWQTKLTKDLSFEQFIHFPLTRHNIKFLQALPGSEDALYSAIPSLLSLLIIVRFLLEYLKHIQFIEILKHLQLLQRKALFPDTLF